MNKFVHDIYLSSFLSFITSVELILSVCFTRFMTPVSVNMDTVQLTALPQEAGSIAEKAAKIRANAVSEYAKPVMTLVMPSTNGNKENMTAIWYEKPRYRIEKNIIIAKTNDLKNIKIKSLMIFCHKLN
jgi:hypothetical protein